MNYRTICFAAMCLASVSATAADGPKRELTDSERASMKKERIARVGGLLPRPGTPAGRIVFVNNQTAVPVEDLMATQERNSMKLRGLCHWTNNVPATVASASAVKDGLKANFALFVIDDAKMPMSLVAMEDKWAFVNIAPLKNGTGADGELLRHRAKNELARVYGVLCGGSASQFKSKLMNAVDTPNDLNGCTDELPVDTTAKMMQYVELRGCKPLQLAPYIRACQEGWAPEPTNDVQRAIWDKVHAQPTEPIKIKPETKKVTE